MADETFLTVADICDRLQVHEQTVRRWIKQEGLPALMFGRRSGYRVRESDLMSWVEEHYAAGATGKAAGLAA